MSNIFPEMNLKKMQNLREYTVQRQSELIEQQNKLQELQDNVNQFNGDLRPLMEKFDDLKKEEKKIGSIFNKFNITATK